MTQKLLATTWSRDVIAITQRGQCLTDLWSEYQNLLAQHFGPAGAHLLAEPVRSETGATDWYGDAGPEKSAEELQTEFADFRQRILALAEQLPAAENTLGLLLPHVLTVPDPSCIRSGSYGPVLVAWAHRPVTQRIEAVDIVGTPSPPRTTPPPPEPTAPALADIPILPPPVEPKVSRLTGPWKAWLLAGLGLLLFAIGLWLLSKLHGLFDNLACLYPHLLFWVLLGLALLLLLVLLATSVPWRRLMDIRRARKVGAQTGVLQIVLAWDDLNDLDLHVICPDGNRLYFGNPQHAGGFLDCDANARRDDAPPPTNRPVENIVWQTSPPQGLYTVIVDPFEMLASTTSRFRVTVRYKNSIIVSQRGTAIRNHRRQPVCNFTLPS